MKELELIRQLHKYNSSNELSKDQCALLDGCMSPDWRTTLFPPPKRAWIIRAIVTVIKRTLIEH